MLDSLLLTLLPLLQEVWQQRALSLCQKDDQMLLYQRDTVPGGLGGWADTADISPGRSHLSPGHYSIPRRPASEVNGRTFLALELASSVPTTAREGVVVSVSASH